MQIAVVADVHLHDLYGGYGMLEEGSGELALRTLADTMASTRVFNESYPAFLAVLDDIARRGIRDVVLLGDYSDDGQLGAVAAVQKVLSFYEKKHGLRFFTTFGNHDCYGPEPRHQAKRLTKADGLEPVLVTSDENAKQPALICSGMRGMSTLEAMEAMSDYGVARPGDDILHWETPFGDHDSLKARKPPDDDGSGLDASYLVEPQEGLWLLMLDANLFQKFDGCWQLRADAAWDHVLAARPYLLEWISEVSYRAEKRGKTLLAFSHYPALPLALVGQGDDLRAACTPDWLKRMPSLDAGRRLAQAGIRWHFSGHMHVTTRVELGGLINIAVPSPVAYPGGYVVVTTGGAQVDVETVRLEHVRGYDVAFSAYRAQIGDGNGPHFADVLSSSTYASFLRAHLQNLIEKKHLPDDWTPAFLACLDTPIGRLFGDAEIAERWPQFVTLPLRHMVEHYYLLRASGSDALRDVSTEKVAFYRDLGEIVGSAGNFESPDIRECARFLELFTLSTILD